MGWYRGVIWWPAQPRSSKSYCLMLRQKSAVFSSHIASKPFKACIFIVASWPVQFFTIRNDVIGGPICLSQEALDGGTLAAQAAHNC
jgi:hypothetical protein